jgi:hypothetical protein
MSLTEEQRGTVGFDLEAARASISHYRIENTSNVDTESALKELVDQANLAEEYLAEIERLRAGHCADCCCARSWEALGISEYTGKSIPEEITHLREWMIKNRDAATELQYQLDDEVKENERLRKIIDSPPEEESWKADYDLLHQLDASGTVCVARKWHAAYRKAQNSNLLRKQENERLLEALDESEKVVAHKTKSAAHWYDEHLQARVDLVQTKRVIYQRDAKIKELEADLEQAERVIEARLEVIDQLQVENKELQESLTAAYLLGAHAQEMATRLKAHEVQNAKSRIKELEAEREKLGKMVRQRGKWLVEERSRYEFAIFDCPQKNSDTSCNLLDGYCTFDNCPIGHVMDQIASEKLQTDGKIGSGDHIVEPDQMIPNGKVWQITEERKAALSAMSSLRTDVDCPQCDAWLHFRDIAEHAPVLRAMLTEAEQCE